MTGWIHGIAERDDVGGVVAARTFDQRVRERIRRRNLARNHRLKTEAT